MKGLILLPEQYNVYMSMGRYMSLFNTLRDKLGFDVIHSDNPSIDNINADIVIIFKSPDNDTPWLMSDIARLPKDKKLIGYFADVHTSGDLTGIVTQLDKEYIIAMDKMLSRCDIILCPYDNAFRNKWPEFVDKYVFFPHFVEYDLYRYLPTSNYRTFKCLLTGSLDIAAYPLRNHIVALNHPLVDFIRHPGYLLGDKLAKAMGFAIGEDYASLLNQYVCSIATSGKMNYVVAKYFEILAAGTILLANYTLDLDTLGFEEEKHYVRIDRGNFVNKLKGVLLDYDKYKMLVEENREFIFDNHTEHNRFKVINEIINGL